MGERERESTRAHRRTRTERENEELILSTTMLTTAMSAMTGKAKGALGCRVGTPSVRATTVCHHMRRHQAATLNNKTQRRSEVTVVARGYPAYQEEPEQEPKRWPDEDFVEEVMEKFPDAGVADIEEGRVLYEMGYTYLDVRSSTEFEHDAKTPRAVNIPLIDTTRKWDLSVTPAVQEVTQSANPKFLEQVKEKFPDKESKLLIVCSDGRQRAIQVLMLLDAEGYTNIVGLKGGYIDWNFVFKGTGGNPLFQKLERRGQTVKYSTVYASDGDDLGVHSTDSTMFGKTDYVDFDPNSVDTETWLKWADEVKTNA